MPAVTRVGDNNTGHDACPPTALSSGSPNVNINGIPAGRVGDPYIPHGCPAHVPHVGNIAAGAPHVFINGKAAGRIGDPVSCGGSVAVGSPNVNIGNGGGEATSNCVKSSVLKTLSWEDANEIDRTILSLPEIAKNMASLADSEEDQKGWNYLALMFERWLGNGARNGEFESYSNNIFLIDFDWLLSYQRVNEAIEEIIRNGINYKSAQILADKLRAQYGEQSEVSGTFDYSLNPQDWEEQYINYVSIPGYWYSDLLGITGLTAAMGAFTIRLLPKGTVETIENGRIKITVNEIAVYADDRFQFKGTYPLLFWSYIDKLFSPFPSSNYKLLFNSDFSQFRILYNKGEDFLIRSKQCKQVEKFNVKTIYLNNTWTVVVLDE